MSPDFIRLSFVEKEILAEKPSDKAEFAPLVNIRPHHVQLIMVKKALLGSENPAVLAKQWVNYYRRSFKYKLQDSARHAYYADCIGITKGDKQKFQETLEVFLIKLQGLPDDNFVEISLKPDGICDSCITGKHCTATRYLSVNGDCPCDTAHFEGIRMQNIIFKLQETGHKKEKDFRLLYNTYTLYDLGGQPLCCADQGKPISVPFKGLLVRALALREAISF